MSETATQPATETSGEPGSVPATTGAGEPASPPAGYVPQSEAETAREEARRARQAAEDLRQELARAKAGAAKPATDEAASSFDWETERRTLLRDVFGAMSMTQTAAAVKSEFPHADPSLFDPDRVSQFSSPEAYRQAVEDSHKRVAAILETRLAEREAELRAELADKFGDAGAGAGGGGTPAGGDPSLERLASMTISELDALEAANPGVIERVKRTAGL